MTKTMLLRPQEATQFTYYVAPVVLGATTIVGFPVPRTATQYAINKDCELLEHGMTIDADSRLFGRHRAEISFPTNQAATKVSRQGVE